MSFMERVRDAWDVVWISAMSLAILAAGLAAILLFVEFVLGVDFIAWLAGDPKGDIRAWLQETFDAGREAVKEKADRIEDSYKNR